MGSSLWIEQKKRYITINFKTLNCESVDISEPTEDTGSVDKSLESRACARARRGDEPERLPRLTARSPHSRQYQSPAHSGGTLRGDDDE